MQKRADIAKKLAQAKGIDIERARLVVDGADAVIANCIDAHLDRLWRRLCHEPDCIKEECLNMSLFWEATVARSQELRGHDVR